MKRSTAALALIIIVGGVAILGAWNRRSELAPGPAIGANPHDTKAAAEAKPPSRALATVDDGREADFQRALLLVRAIKGSMNDPSSLDVSEAYASPTAVAIKYRGKNSFGALVINYAVATKDGKAASGSKQDVAALWNKHIANKPLTDLSAEVQGARMLGVY